MDQEEHDHDQDGGPGQEEQPGLVVVDYVEHRTPDQSAQPGEEADVDQGGRDEAQKVGPAGNPDRSGDLIGVDPQPGEKATDDDGLPAAGLEHS